MKSNLPLNYKLVNIFILFSLSFLSNFFIKAEVSSQFNELNKKYLFDIRDRIWKKPRLRNLQISPKIFSELIGANFMIEFYGNSIFYDNTLKRIFTILPDIVNPAIMILIAAPYNTNNPADMAKITVHANSCTFIQNSGPLPYIPYNLAYIDNPSKNGDKNFAIFYNQNTSTNPFPRTDCPPDPVDSSFYTFNMMTNSFVLTKTWTSIFTSTIISDINAKTGNYCQMCNLFQPRASVWVKSSERLISLYMYSQTGVDLFPNGKKLFILLISLADTTLSSPVDRVLIYDDMFSSSLINVRKIYNVPNTNIVYFILQEVSNSFIVTINIDTATPYVKNFGNKIPIGTQLWKNENQYGIDYDESSSQFVQFYVSNIDNFNNCQISAFYFKLINGYTTIGSYYSLSPFFSYPLQGPSNSVMYLKILGNFIFFCDFYVCASSKIVNRYNLGYDKTIIFPWKIFSNISVQGGKIKFAEVFFTSDKTDIYAWFVGNNFNPQPPSNRFFIGNNTPLANGCMFYIKSDWSKCQAECETGWVTYDIYKYCINDSCPTKAKYLYNFVCTATCKEMNAIELYSKSKLCRNIPCAVGQYFTDVKYTVLGLYHECVSSCPSNLFQNDSTRICADYCDTNIFEDVILNGSYVKRCLGSCPLGYANLKRGVGDAPFRCTNTNYCPLGAFIVRPYEHPIPIPSTACVSECPQGFIKDYTGFVCTRCLKVADGYRWKDKCFDKCPEFAYSPTENNMCINCKDSNLNWFNGKCTSDVPQPSILVNNDFNAYKICKDVGKLIYGNNCVDAPCPGNSYPYENNKSQCLDFTNDKKFSFNDTSVDNCPPAYGSDIYGRCYKCKVMRDDLYEYNRNCVSSCPGGFYADEQNICKDCQKPGSIQTESFKKICLVPECPSNSLTDRINKKCIYCKDTNKFKYKNSCVDQCPYNSEIDFEKNTCNYCGEISQNYYYKNKCYSKCPEGTNPTDTFSCIDKEPSCNPNPCMNGGKCSVINIKINCICKNELINGQKYVGQYCQIDQNYPINFYNGYVNYIKNLISNYTMYNSINNVIINLDENEINKINANLKFLEDNHPQFETIFNDIYNNLVQVLDQYLITIKKIVLNYPSIKTYSIYENILNIINSLFKNKLNNSRRFLDQNYNLTYSDMSDKIKMRILSISDVFVQKNLNLNYLNQYNLDLNNFKISFFYTDARYLVKSYENFIKNKTSYLDIFECEEYIKNAYSIPYMGGYTLDWSDDSLYSILNTDSVDKILMTKTFSINFFNPYTFKLVDLPTECTNNIPNSVIFLKFYLNFEKIIDKKIYDYYSNKYINIYDKNSKFYQDRCFIFVTNDGFDITQAYRKKNLSPGVYVSCGDGCVFIGIDLNNFMICQCQARSIINTSNDKFVPFRIYLKSINYDFIDVGNLSLIKCALYVFNNDYSLYNIRTKLNSNLGFWISVGLFIFTILIILVLYPIFLIAKINDKNSNYINYIIYFDAEYYHEKISPFLKIKNNLDKINKLLNVEIKYDVTVNSGINANIKINEDIVNELIKNVNVDDKNLLHMGEIEIKLNEEEAKYNKINRMTKSVNKINTLNSYQDQYNGESEKMFNINIHSLYISHNQIKGNLSSLAPLLCKTDLNYETNLNYQEILNLKIEEVIQNDKRNFFNFYYDWLINYNYFFFAFFSYSLIYPYYIRIIILMTNIHLEFMLNAMLFTDQYIDKMYETKNKYGLNFIFMYQFDKVIYSILLAQIPILIFRYLLIKPNHNIKKNFNEFLITKNYNYIEKGYKVYMRHMIWRYYTLIFICLIFFGWSLFYNTLFCGIYANTHIMWMYGGIVSFIFNTFVLQGIFFPLLFYSIKLCANSKIKCFVSLYKIIRN